MGLRKNKIQPCPPKFFRRELMEGWRGGFNKGWGFYNESRCRGTLQNGAILSSITLNENRAARSDQHAKGRGKRASARQGSKGQRRGPGRALKGQRRGPGRALRGIGEDKAGL